MPKKKKTPAQPELQQMLEEMEEKWKRALADYQNLERRIEKQQASYIMLASVGLMRKLLPVLDDLKRAEAHLHDAGVSMIVKQFEEILTTEGVERISTVGVEFDPHTMECQERVEGEVDVVIEELRSGYQLREVVIRPALVTVGGKATKD